MFLGEFYDDGVHLLRLKSYLRPALTVDVPYYVIILTCLGVFIWVVKVVREYFLKLMQGNDADDNEPILVRCDRCHSIVSSNSYIVNVDHED